MVQHCKLKQALQFQMQLKGFGIGSLALDHVPSLPLELQMTISQLQS